MYETKKPYEKNEMKYEIGKYYDKKSTNYDSNSSNKSIDYLLPEWVSVLKKYFKKYDG